MPVFEINTDEKAGRREVEKHGDEITVSVCNLVCFWQGGIKSESQDCQLSNR